MRDKRQGLPPVRLRPVFVDVMPPFDSIKEGELWVSLKHRTVNLRCPCGCGNLTVLSLHPSRWHVSYDGKSVSLNGPTGGSIWAFSGCGSHYFIRNNTVIWSCRIDPSSHMQYARMERERMATSAPNLRTRRSWLGRLRDIVLIRWRRG